MQCWGLREDQGQHLPPTLPSNQPMVWGNPILINFEAETMLLFFSQGEPTTPHTAHCPIPWTGQILPAGCFLPAIGLANWWFFSGGRTVYHPLAFLNWPYLASRFHFFPAFELTETNLVNLGGATFHRLQRRSKLVRSRRYLSNG